MKKQQSPACSECGFKGELAAFVNQVSIRELTQDNAFPWQCPHCKRLAMTAAELFGWERIKGHEVG